MFKSIHKFTIEFQSHEQISRSQARKILDKMINIAIADAEDTTDQDLENCGDAEIVCRSEFVLSK